MPKSMTGFAKVEMESGDGKCYGEARSLNSRYLEIALRLPRSASGYESRLREAARRFVRRGRLDITIKWDRGGDAAVPKANEEAIAWYIGLARRLKDSHGLEGGLGVADLLGLKDILVYEEEAPPEETLFSCFETLLAGLNGEREREGALIGSDLSERLSRIAGWLKEIEARWPEVVKTHEETLRRKVLEISGTAADEARVLQEMGFYMERLDIAEEIARLKGHLGLFKATLASTDEIGRKLDFIIQEMVRETNTIASKSGDLSISEKAILIKVEIEKMREQVQNVE